MSSTILTILYTPQRVEPVDPTPYLLGGMALLLVLSVAVIAWRARATKAGARARREARAHARSERSA